MRITAQLIQAEDGFHLWSETYDGDLADVFELQERIAGQIVKALEVELGQAPARRRGRRPMPMRVPARAPADGLRGVASLGEARKLFEPVRPPLDPGYRARARGPGAGRANWRWTYTPVPRPRGPGAGNHRGRGPPRARRRGCRARARPAQCRGLVDAGATWPRMPRATGLPRARRMTVRLALSPNDAEVLQLSPATTSSGRRTRAPSRPSRARWRWTRAGA